MSNEAGTLPGMEFQEAPSAKVKRGRKPKAESAHEEPAGDKITKSVDPRNALNELISTEWLPETISVWTQRGLGANHPDARIEREHPAPFSFTDVARLVRFFTKKGQTVLDPFAGVGSEIAALVNEHAFDYLDAPVARVCAADVPTPYATNLEKLATPQPEDIVAAVKKVCYR